MSTVAPPVQAQPGEPPTEARRPAVPPSMRGQDALPGGLADLVLRLGPGVLRPLTQVPDWPVAATVLRDPGDPDPVAEHALVLLLGGRGGDPATLSTVVSAGRASAAVVVRAGAEEPADLVQAASDTGAVLLAAPSGLPWEQLLALVQAALPASTGTGAAPLGDLFALTGAVAVAVGGAVALESPHGQVLAYSTVPGQTVDLVRQQGILGRHIPSLPDNDERYRRVHRSRGVVRVPGQPPDLLPRLAVAVRAGEQLLGSLWVVDAGGLTPGVEATLRDAAGMAAMHLLRARSHEEVERAERTALVRSLLEGRADAEATARRLGLASAAPVAVLALRLPDDSDEALAQQVGDLARLQAAAVSRRVEAVVSGRTVHVLVPAPPPTSRARLLGLAEAVAERAAGALGLQVLAGVGGTAPGLAGVPGSRREADAVLRVLARRRGGAVATLESVREQVALLALEEHLADDPGSRLPAVDALRAHDAEHGTAYAPSLLAWLGCLGDVVAASGRLHVHPNTFRYRLRRARELFEVDLDDPDTRLVLWLQLRLLRDGGAR